MNFEHLAEFQIIYVVGPQRSGTRCIAKMIANDTGRRYIDETEFAVDSLHQLVNLIYEAGSERLVIQGPGLTAWVDRLATMSDAVVFCWRDLDEIFESAERVWADRYDRIEAGKYGKSDGSAAIKQQHWPAQEKILHHPFLVQYPQDVEDHDLFVPREKRENWEFDQTATLRSIRGLDDGDVITAFTCTGGRQETFTQLEKYVARQTIRPAHWVVVDDVRPETEFADTGIDQHVIIPESYWKPGDHTYARNFRRGLEYIIESLPDTKWVAIFEDDDWYSPKYLEFFIPILKEKFDQGILMTGEHNNVYYHVGVRRWKRVGAGGRNATLATTLFHVDLIPEILEVIGGYDEMSLDLKIFRGISQDKWITFDTDHVIGMKGIPQLRDGGTHSHTIPSVQRYNFTADGDMQMLRHFVGEDVEFYEKFFDAEMAAELLKAPESPRQQRRRMLAGKRLEIENARRRRR